MSQTSAAITAFSTTGMIVALATGFYPIAALFGLSVYVVLVGVAMESAPTYRFSILSLSVNIPALILAQVMGLDILVIILSASTFILVLSVMFAAAKGAWDRNRTAA